MSTVWSDWFNTLPSFPGLLAAGLRSPEQAAFSRAWSEGYPEAAMANAWRCADDTFRVMRLHRFPTRTLRWTYSNAILTGVRRNDGWLLLIITRIEPTGEPDPILISWIEAFLADSGK